MRVAAGVGLLVRLPIDSAFDSGRPKQQKQQKPKQTYTKSKWKQRIIHLYKRMKWKEIIDFRLCYCTDYPASIQFVQSE